MQRALQRTLTVATIPQPGEQISLQQAVQTAIEKNYQIQITRAEQEIARNNYDRGAAGYLPIVTGNFTSNGSLQNINQTFLQNLRPPQEIRGAFNRTNTVGLNATYNILDFDRGLNYNRLGELVRFSEVTTRANMEATAASVTSTYYDVIRQLQRLIAFRQALSISRERLELARANYEVGTRSRVDYLSAQVDYNADSAALVAQEQSLRNAKIVLNTLMVREPLTEFAVRDTILVRTDLQLEPLRQAVSNNPLLVQAVLNRRLADIDVRIARAQQLPQVGITTGYNQTFINNQGGFGVATAHNRGLTYSLTAAVPIFNGYNLRRQINNAKINTQIAERQELDQRLQLVSALEQTFTQYQNSLTLLNLEVQNFNIARQNVDIAFERYRVGNSTAVEFRDVQRNAVAAETRLIDAEYNAKVAEIELLRLTSTIF
ncbi:TolC family protein [Tellurirhabdus rosea]|uniref:TolC family protein n=1 Tax=Tellurirhabdus rosea TaxID=2674997 RepID=UPI002251FAD5|nr:TolC family protein [Tellurirhabdus rosea]